MFFRFNENVVQATLSFVFTSNEVFNCGKKSIYKTSFKMVWAMSNYTDSEFSNRQSAIFKHQIFEFLDMDHDGRR